MARETAAQRYARLSAERADQEMVRAMNYPTRLMELLERAVNVNFELTVKNGEFRVEDRDDRRANAYLLDVRYTKHADNTLDSLLWDVRDKEEAAAEAHRRALVRTAALNKLSAEEREALGL